MEADFAALLAALGAILALDGLVVLLVLGTKRRRRRAWAAGGALLKELRDAMLARDPARLAALARRSGRAFLPAARRVLEACRDEPAVLGALRSAAAESGLDRRALRAARSPLFHRRIRAYLDLGLLGGAEAEAALLRAATGDKRRFGRLVALDRLARAEPEPDIEALAARLEALPSLGEAEAKVLSRLGPAFARRCAARLGPGALPPGDAGLRLLLLAVAAAPDETGWERAREVAESRADALGELAAGVLAERFPPSRFLAAFAGRAEPRFAVRAARLLGRTLGPEGAAALDPYFARPETRGAAVEAAGELARRFPEASLELLEALGAGDEARASGLALALEHRLPYLAHHQGGPARPALLRMCSLLLAAGRPGPLLALVESPLPAEVRSPLVALLREAVSREAAVAAFMARHAGPALLAELSLPPLPAEESKPRIPVGARDKVFVAALVLAGLAVFPLAFLLRHGGELPYLTAPEALHRFVFDFHFLFAFYTLAVNGIYLLLLGLSAAKLLSQSLLWESGLGQLLFSSGLLPRVTIVAPAFNEESTLADSVESLLALAYPDYEVVVVNDGSKDGTLEAAARAFALEPVASGGPEGGGTAGDGRATRLPTMPVRTVYRSKVSPNLLLVDKVNGGKADALNAGLNLATGEYVCCIDADSLLDPEALHRAMLQVLASEEEVVAIGGNILPVNGCEVERGRLRRIGLASHPLAAFQTVEYLRSFVSGRLGWALLDGLLIISGAFGLFRRDRVLAAGGYMTGKGAFRKDTVGEDMELVVRLVRAEREAGRRGRVDYCFNANCWTEVPEEGRALSRQRDRWHRGLVEVLLHHRRMAFRPRYGTSGLLAVPYFFAFELVGPWLELSGYLVLAASLALSLIDPLVSLVVFSLALLLGVLISLCSVLLAERQVVYFRPREFLRLVALAVAENFGFRQLMSLSRSWAFVQFFYKSKGWQKFGRKGFARPGGAA